MRKSFYIGFIILICILTRTVAFADDLTIILDGNELQFDVPPRIESGRTLVPLRSLFEAMGATVSYDPATRTIQVHRSSNRIVLRVDSSIAWLNGTPVELDVPARIVNDRTLIPLRFIAESLGTDVLWESESRSIFLETNSKSTPLAAKDFTDEEGMHLYYQWKFRNVNQLTEITLDPDLVSYYEDHQRIPSDDYSIYVTEPLDDKAIAALAIQFRKQAEALGLTEQEMINYVITFVQYLEYRLDKDSNGVNEYPQYPLETLAIKGGDCEDTSILLAALLKALGHDPIIIHYPGIHTAVGLEMMGEASLLRYPYKNHLYTYIETTRPYEIGRIPEEFSELGAVFFEIVPAPAVRFRWESDADGIEIRVWNEGTGAAERLQVQVQIIGRDGTLYYSVSSSPEFLRSDSHTDIQLDLKYPENTRMQLKVTIYNAGKFMADSHSKWFGEDSN